MSRQANRSKQTNMSKQANANREIERKFRVRDDTWTDSGDGVEIRQGYLARTDRGVVRVRIAGDAAFLTIKGKTIGISRAEFEYEIPRDDALALLDLCQGSVIEKTRYHVPHEGHVWEVDVFRGANQGLVLAEIELEHEAEPFASPSWLGVEVSHDPRYRNSNLGFAPYSKDWDRN